MRVVFGCALFALLGFRSLWLSFALFGFGRFGFHLLGSSYHGDLFGKYIAVYIPGGRN
jgi:hypothetical protein